MRWLIGILFSLALQAQLLINVGGPATGSFVMDSYCTGQIWGASNDPSMGNLPGVYATLRYGTVNCSIPMPNGYYQVQLDLLEPNKTGPGQRKFSITVNGLTTQVLDLFALAGLQQQYQLLVPALVTNGLLTIRTNFILGNPVLSGIEVQPQLGPQGPIGPAGPAGPVGPLPTGVVCSSLTPATGVTMVVTLRDGSCLPINILAAPGTNLSTVQAVWFNANAAGALTGQSIFGVVSAAPIQ
jgi:hypothetical protein